MTQFVLIALAMSLAVAVVMCAALWRRGDSKRPRRGQAVVLGAAVPAAAMALYFLVGTPEALDPSALEPSGDLDRLTTRLAERLEQDPENLEGWVLLGRSRMVQERPGDAARAFRRALSLAPDDPAVMVELAEAQAHANAFRLEGEPARLLDEAIRLDPSNQRALWFGGLADWQAADFRRAARRWETLLGLLEPGSPVARSVRDQLDAARTRLGGAPASAVEPDAPATVRVRVALDERFADDVSPDQAVFVFARDPGGGGMPLAVQRLSAGALPAEVTLDSSNAMTGGRTLSDARRVEIVARVSRSGSPTAGDGDLEGRAGPLDVGASATAEVVIDRRLGPAENAG